jgi:hypothetical protein
MFQDMIDKLFFYVIVDSCEKFLQRVSLKLILTTSNLFFKGGCMENGSGVENAVARFTQIAGQEKFRGWPVVGTPVIDAKIDFFGQTIKYQLATGNGTEDYTSILRHFGWVVVFGVTKENKVITLVQWKPGVNRASWELPPGGIGKIGPGVSRGEIIDKTKMVYTKETGFGGGDWHYLDSIDIESGKFRGASFEDHGLPAHMMLATGLEKIQDARQPNRNEIMETLEVPLDEWPEVIASGKFREASALPCALLALMKLGKLKWA